MEHKFMTILINGLWLIVVTAIYIEYCSAQTAVVNETAPDLDTNELPECPHTYDNVMHWSKSKAGTDVVVQCPKYISAFDWKHNAAKRCEVNFQWSESNYTLCIDDDSLMYRNILHHYHLAIFIMKIGYDIYLIHFISVRAISQDRLKIYMWMYISSVAHQVFALISNFMENKEDIMNNNKYHCGSIHLLSKLSLLLPYNWMLCGMIYLFQTVVKVYSISAIFFSAIYILLRKYATKDTARCFSENSIANLAITIPICFDITLCSILAFVLLVRVRKNTFNVSPDVVRKNTLIFAAYAVIPLLGLSQLDNSPPTPASVSELITAMILKTFQFGQFVLWSLLNCIAEKPLAELQSGSRPESIPMNEL